MCTREDYGFNVSISLEGYYDKVISGAMIGSSKDPNNKAVRKSYGFSAAKGIGYKETFLTAQQLHDALVSGHVFCHLFNPTKLRKDGTFGSSQKKNDYFKGSYVVGIDIDKTNYSSVEDFIEKLSMKPTIYYTSYSNKQEGKGARFRLLYVFDELIRNKFFFRYVAWQINAMIERDTNEKISDDCNLRCAQYFNGTNKNNPNLVVSSGCSNLIYSFLDFGVTEPTFIQFLQKNCYYKTNIHKAEILALLRWYERQGKVNLQSSQDNAAQSKRSGKNAISTPTLQVTTQTRVEYDKYLLHDMEKKDYNTFQRRWRKQFKYIYRIEKDWNGKEFQQVDDDYFAFPFSYGKRAVLRDGMKRRKTLFLRMCLRRVMKPSATPDEILWNTYEDIHRFFDFQGLDMIDFLKRNIVACFSLSIDEIKERYSETITHLKEVTKPKRGIIYRNKKARSVETTYQVISTLFDSTKSVTENLAILNSHGYKFEKSSIYNFMKEREIKIKKSTSKEKIWDYVDITLSCRKNKELLEQRGYSVSINTVMKVIQDKKKQHQQQTTQEFITHSLLNWKEERQVDNSSFSSTFQEEPTIYNKEDIQGLQEQGGQERVTHSILDLESGETLPKKKRFVPDFILVQYQDKNLTLYDRLKNVTKKEKQNTSVAHSQVVEDTYFFTPDEMQAYIQQDFDTLNPLFD